MEIGQGVGRTETTLGASERQIQPRRLTFRNGFQPEAGKYNDD